MLLKIFFASLILSSLCWAKVDYQPFAESTIWSVAAEVREIEEVLPGEEELVKEDLARSRWRRNAGSGTTTESSSSGSSWSCSVGMIVGPVLAVIALVDIGILIFVLYRRRALKICMKGGSDLAVNEESPYEVPGLSNTEAPAPATPATAAVTTSRGQSIPLQILNSPPVAGQSRSSPTALEPDSVYHEIDDTARKRQDQGAPPTVTTHAPAGKTQSSYSNVPADQRKEGSPRAGTGNKDDPYYTRVIPDNYEKLVDVHPGEGGYGYTSIATSEISRTGEAPPSRQQGNKNPYYLHAV